jgi:hypothetical protein
VTTNAKSRNYGAANPTFDGGITGIQNGDNITATYASTATAASPIGSYPISATLVDPTAKLGNYSVTNLGNTLTIGQTPLVVTTNAKSRNYGAANPTFDGGITGIQNGDNITATYASTAVVTSPVGGYPISATIVDPDGKLGNYSVTNAGNTLTINQTPLVVTTNDKSRAYGAADPTFDGSISGIQNGDNITATYATTATVTSPVGPYPITATIVDPTSKLGNYAVTNAGGTLTVGKATIMVTAEDKSRVYGAANPALTAAFTGFVNGETVAVLSGAPALSTTATPASPIATTYPITAAIGSLSASNYYFSFTFGTLTLTAAPL